MGKQSKQTRKFAPKLKKVIQRRKEYQKNRDKYKKTGTSNGEESDRKIQNTKQQQQKVTDDKAAHKKDIKDKKEKKANEDEELAGLNADEFLEDGFFNEMGDDEESGGEEVIILILIILYNHFLWQLNLIESRSRINVNYKCVNSTLKLH